MSDEKEPKPKERAPEHIVPWTPPPLGDLPDGVGAPRIESTGYCGEHNRTYPRGLGCPDCAAEGGGG